MGWGEGGGEEEVRREGGGRAGSRGRWVVGGEGRVAGGRGGRGPGYKAV